MVPIMMPSLERLSDGTPVAIWHDESDPRWVIATFLRSDIGFSVRTAQEILAGLNAVISGALKSWQWDGNAFRVQADERGCLLELCDADLPPHVRPVRLGTLELKEIVSRWNTHIS